MLRLGDYCLDFKIEVQKMSYKTPTFICSICNQEKSIDQRARMRDENSCLTCNGLEVPKS
jgi:hypothetical protein